MSAFEKIMLPFRPSKPRNAGLTMVLDKNLGIQALNDLLDTAGEFIDIVKFGWGTSRILPFDLVRRKIEILSKCNVLVCPGGTFLEIAYAKGMANSFLEEAKNIGFSCIEVSDGAIQIKHENKLELIKKAKDLGFTVISEVGKKFEMEEKRYPIEERINHVLKELETGSFKVIIEARESGSSGIFDKSGDIMQEFVEIIIAQLGTHNLIFEAPRPEQQHWLISNIGNSVNLGNINPDDCVNLETLRCGLRANTLREYHLNRTSVFIENGVGGALHAASKKDVVIIVDALRASTTIITALAEGVASVKPVVSADECIGELTAGERGGEKIPGLDYDNSPLSFRSSNCAHKQLVLTTSNGTECIKAAGMQNSTVLIGSLINAKAVSEKALDIAKSTNRHITIVMAGRNNQLALEDLISASEIVANFKDCSVKGYIKPVYSVDYEKDFLNSESGKNLIALGKEKDVLFCAKKNLYKIVPVFKNGLLLIA